MDFSIIPMRKEFLHRARSMGLDDQHQPVVRCMAAGGEPCRDVLRRASQGEALLLASYCPFSLPGPYREYGPVFILAEASDEPIDSHPISAASGIPASYLGEQFVLRAYDAGERIVAAVLSSPDRCLADLGNLFQRHPTRFVLARYAAYGCYGCRIELRH